MLNEVRSAEIDPTYLEAAMTARSIRTRWTILFDVVWGLLDGLATSILILWVIVIPVLIVALTFFLSGFPQRIGFTTAVAYGCIAAAFLAVCATAGTVGVRLPRSIESLPYRVSLLIGTIAQSLAWAAVYSDTLHDGVFMQHIDHFPRLESLMWPAAVVPSAILAVSSIVGAIVKGHDHRIRLPVTLHYLVAISFGLFGAFWFGMFVWDGLKNGNSWWNAALQVNPRGQYFVLIYGGEAVIGLLWCALAFCHRREPS